MVIGGCQEGEKLLSNTWEWIRLFGFLAYFYFTISIIFGLLRKTSFVKSHKNLIYQIHQNAGWMGLFTLIVHVLALIIDSYKPYNLVEILIPFSADYEPITSGLGTIAFYGFLVVLMTSDLWIKTMNRSMWKNMHLLVLPAWVLSLFHGIIIGSDSGNLLVLLFYAVTAGFTLFIVTLRRMSQGNTKSNASI